MKKAYSILIWALGLLSVACQPESITLDIKDWVSFTPSSITLAAQGDTQEVTVNSKLDWTVQSAPSWVSLSSNSGKAGSQTLSVTASVNDGEIRSGEVVLSFTGMDETKSFSVSQDKFSLPTQVYVPGSHNNWSFDKALNATARGLYEGFMTIGGAQGFTVTPERNRNTEWGLDPSRNVTKDGSFTVYPIKLKSGTPVMQGSSALYGKVIVDLNNSVVKIAPVESVGLIGSVNGWAQEFDYLGYDRAADKWTANGVSIPANTVLKFRMNSNWGINLGGPLDNLVQDGADIPIQEGGDYTVELFLSTVPYRATFTRSSTSFTFLYGTYTASGYKAYDWGSDLGGAATYDFPAVTLAEYPGNPNRVLILNLDPMLYAAGAKDENNMLYGEIKDEGRRILIPSGQKYLGDYYFMPLSLAGTQYKWLDEATVSVVDAGKALQFDNCSFSLYKYVSAEDSGFLEIYAAPLYLTRKQ